MTTALILASRKPRNPLVAAARSRRAGFHQPSRHGQRQQAQQAMRRELSQAQPYSP